VQPQKQRLLQNAGKTTVRLPTQVDVAERAGVSRATVSYVINGQTNGKVSISAETVDRVMQAVKELGYEPDAGAQALRTGSSKTIGLIIPDLHNPHFWENADGVEQAARVAGYRLLLSSTDLNAQYGEEIFKDLSGRRIDALILIGVTVDQSAEARATLTRSISRNLPIVEVNDRVQTDSRVDCVISDYRSATSEAMAHLFSLGHRRIGLVYGVATADLAVDRLEPYREALMSQGIPVEDALVVNCGPTFEDGYQAAMRLLQLKNHPTAIVAINDILALGVLRAAGDQGLHVPQDFSLVGFDDIPAARYLVPRLTTASKDAVRMGREAVRLALRRIEDPSQPSTVIRIPSQLIIRESTSLVPSRNRG
jgi:DNA-binding LacI/PurR family transcriptional regulator